MDNISTVDEGPEGCSEKRISCVVKVPRFELIEHFFNFLKLTPFLNLFDAMP